MSNDDPTQAASPADAAPAEASADTPEQVMLAASDRISQLEAERDEFRERWMRSEAEMANLRARTKREVDETRQYAVQKFARDVAEAADNLRRGVAAVPAPAPDEPDIVGRLRDGFAGVERSFIALLDRNGIKSDDPTGAMFDPNLHQSMAEHETAEHPPGTVIQAWTPSWTLNGRLLRPAMVVVAKAPAPAAATGPRVDTTA
jgi:molecular chaperone GrpE